LVSAARVRVAIVPCCNTRAISAGPAPPFWESGKRTDTLNSRRLALSRGGRLSDHKPLRFAKEYRVANIKSQQKRIRTNERARLRNKSVKSSLRTAVRAFREAAAAGEKEKAAELLVSASRKLDKAASKGVIHKNQAANKKSALAHALNKL
jgi:small subunit ribosomal protein S20